MTKNRANWEKVCNYLEENKIKFIPGSDGIYVPNFNDEKLLKRYIEYYEKYMEELAEEVKL